MATRVATAKTATTATTMSPNPATATTTMTLSQQQQWVRPVQKRFNSLRVRRDESITKAT